ncbi:MAG: FAD-dependent oxidoreductase [Streptosporangiales bacterium]|nr:FAD-dependent oxidoreductase [Streptosporangiales bacterium]
MRPVLNGGRVVVVGGGVVGVSLAYHLAAFGYRDVVVVERGLLGEGSTAKATGGIRTQFSSPLNARLAHAAVDYFAHFEERVGEPLEFRQHGYLFVLDDERQLAVFRASAEMQRSLGVEVELLEPDAIPSLVPGIVTGDVVGAAYTPNDGSASPADVVQAFARQARRGGVTFRQETEVVGFVRDGAGAVTGVETTGGRLDAELVVVAAGPWAADVGRLAGVTLPVEPHSRQAFGIDALPELTADMPLTVDLGSGAYVHPERSGGIIGGNDRDTPIALEPRVDWDLTGQLIESLVRRVPWLVGARITSGWAGLREMSPDDHGIVGAVPEVPGLWVAVGFSGHGFMQAPIVGTELARTLLGLETTIDLTPLRPTRFAEGALVEESAVF